MKVVSKYSSLERSGDILLTNLLVRQAPNSIFVSWHLFPAGRQCTDHHFVEISLPSGVSRQCSFNRLETLN